MNYSTTPHFHGELLVALARRMQPSLYVELGCENGSTTQEVAQHCERAIGVDIRDYQPKGFEFFCMPSVTFLSEVLPGLTAETGLVELAFIDGDHRRASVTRELGLLWPFVADDGLVALHDTFPEDKQQTGDDWCSDSWMLAVNGFSGLDGAEWVTLPFPPGLTLLHKRRGRFLPWLESEKVADARR